MRTIVFAVEGRAERELLNGLLPRMVGAEVEWVVWVFEGKTDLERKIEKRIRGWLKPDTRFLVLRDQDQGDCFEIKRALANKCLSAGRPDTAVRIACRELESWYLADLAAVEKATGVGGLARKQAKKQYRDPDNNLGNPAQELDRITNGCYQKIIGSRLLGPLLDLDNRRSNSFRVFIEGVRRLAA